jgi:hypothetical protein
MSDEVFSEDEGLFLRMVDNFYSAYSLTKVCARKCDILKPTRTDSLSSSETECLSKSSNEQFVDWYRNLCLKY